MRKSCLALLLPLAACQSSDPDPRGVDRDETLLTVTASGRADATPDEARIQLGVQSLGPNAQEASRANREKMEQVQAALSRLAIKPADIQTRNLSLNRIDFGKDRGRYRADNVVEVRMRDARRVGEAIASATDAGANLLSGPELRISDREQANRSAYAAAYRSARARAEAYAGAAGLKIGRVLAIYDNGEFGPPAPYARTGSYNGMAVEQAMAAPASPPPPPSVMPFSPGTSTTEVRVRVDFALTQ